MNPDSLLFLTGNTASGKKRVAKHVAAILGAEVLSLDSVKVYRGMTIGSAKDVESRPLLTDLVEPTDVFSTGMYLERAKQEVEALRSKGRLPLFVGGTGLYLNALVRGMFDGPKADEALRQRLHRQAEEEGNESLHTKLKQVDPRSAERVNPNDRHRLVRALEVHELTGETITELRERKTRPPIEGPCRLVGLRWPREVLAQRIEDRIRRMYEGGLLEECRKLIDLPLSREPARAIGYREGFACLRGEMSEEEAIERTIYATRQFARRQRNWFKQFDEIRWVEMDDSKSAEKAAEEAVALFTEEDGL